jgi:penicillin-binding protein 2
VAALETGIIKPGTTILTRGLYDYYSSPQPACWIYNRFRGSHGYLNVTDAITVSCNYFFYEVGRLTGIDTLESYARQFGFGQSTGIEIGDSAGILASPDTAEKVGDIWTDGQTLTAAIGQSYNLFTPLQLANYTATLAGNGEHYRAHLLKNVKTYDNSSLIYAASSEPLNTVEMSASTQKAVLKGMRNLATGSLYSYFYKCPVTVAAKTGTAEVGGGDVNGVFIAVAPYDDPQIAVAVAIEKAKAGSDLAPIAADIISAYFSREEIGTVILGENTLIQ